MKQIHFNIGISIIIVILILFVSILGLQYYKTKNQYEQTKEELQLQKTAQEERAKAVTEMNAKNLWQEYCNSSLNTKDIQAEMLYYYRLTKGSLANKKVGSAIEEYIRIIKNHNETLNKRKEYCNESMDYDAFTHNQEFFDLPSSEMLGVMKQEFMDQDMMKQKLNECNNKYPNPTYNYGCQKEDGELVCFRIKNCYNTSTQIKKRVQVVNSKGEIIREEKEVFFDLEEFKSRPITICNSESC